GFLGGEEAAEEARAPGGARGVSGWRHGVLSVAGRRRRVGSVDGLDAPAAGAVDDVDALVAGVLGAEERLEAVGCDELGVAVGEEEVGAGRPVVVARGVEAGLGVGLLGGVPVVVPGVGRDVVAVGLVAPDRGGADDDLLFALEAGDVEVADVV